jgi:hypothetical protein
MTQTATPGPTITVMFDSWHGQSYNTHRQMNTISHTDEQAAEAYAQAMSAKWDYASVHDAHGALLFSYADGELFTDNRPVTA